MQNPKPTRFYWSMYWEMKENKTKQKNQHRISILFLFIRLSWKKKNPFGFIMHSDSMHLIFYTLLV